VVDLEQFRLKGKATSFEILNPSRRVPQQRGRFLKGPVPLGWLREAGKLPGKTLHVGMELWFQVGLHRSHEVRFSYTSGSEFGVTRHSAYRALRALEQAGLIIVNRHRGRSPIVRIVKGELPLEKRMNKEPGFSALK